MRLDYFNRLVLGGYLMGLGPCFIACGGDDDDMSPAAGPKWLYRFGGVWPFPKTMLPGIIAM